MINKIGNTPLIEIKNISKIANIYAKLEYCNIFGSIKDRVALEIISEAERMGKLNSKSIIAEATSGNMGIALSGICKIKGYSCIIAMPENMSEQRKALIKSYGAKLLLTPEKYGMVGSISKINELININPNIYYCDQFNNYSSILTHKKFTAPEINEQLNSKIDVIISGIGTAATLMGISNFFKSKNKHIEIVGILPLNYPHKIQGIGAGFLPPLLADSSVDKIIKVTDSEAIKEKENLLLKNKLDVGISSGAVIAGAKKLLKNKSYNGKNIVLIFADGGDRYK